MSRLPLLPDRPRPLVFAHRGCSSLAPENTMAAFSLAKRMGVPGIELDIHLCATGELVVAHDHTFRRLAGPGASGSAAHRQKESSAAPRSAPRTAPGSAPGNDGSDALLDRSIEELSFADLSALDIGSWFGPDFANERPPLLEEVLEAFIPDMYIDIEMKSKKSSGDALPSALAALLKKFGESARRAVTVTSFNPMSLRAFKKIVQDIPTAIIWSSGQGVPWYLKRGEGRWISACDYLKPVHTQATRPTITLLSSIGGRPLVPWTVDDPKLAGDLIDRGCAGIITNRPQDLTFLKG